MTQGAAASPPLGLSEYELRHLAAHLEASGRAADLHRLLGLETPALTGPHLQNLWFGAKSQIGDDVGYAEDVERAWQIARTASLAGEAVPHDNRSLDKRSLEIRYALIVASLASQAAGVPPGLVAQLVSGGTWATERALAAARRMPDLERRTETLAAIATRASLTAEARDQVLREALQVAEQISDGYRRSRTVAALALQLPATLLPLAYRPPVTSATALEAQYSTGATANPLVTVEQRPLTEADVKRVFAEAAAFEVEAERVQRLSPAIPYVTKATSAVAVRLVTDLEGELQRTLALAQLVPRLVELGQVDQARAALGRLASARSLDEGVARLRTGDPQHRPEVTDPFWAAESQSRDVIPGGPDEAIQLERALDDARQLGDGPRCDQLVRAGVALLARLGAGEAAVALVDRIHLPAARADAIAALAAANPLSVAALVEAAGAIDDLHQRCVAFLAAVARADRATQESQAATIEEIALQWDGQDLGPAQAADVLARAAGLCRLPDQTRTCRCALRLARSQGDDIVAQTLATGLRTAPVPWLLVAAEATALIDDDLTNSFALHEVASAAARAGTLALGLEPLDLATSITDPWWRNATIAAIAEAATLKGHGEIALRAVGSLEPTFVTPSLVGALGSLLDCEAARELRGLLNRGEDPARRAHGLAALARTSPASWREEAVHAAMTACAMPGDERVRSLALATLTEIAAPQHLDELRRLAATFDDPAAEAVAAIALLLADTDERRADEVVRERLRRLDPETAAVATLRLAAISPATSRRLTEAMIDTVEQVSDTERRLLLLRAVAATLPSPSKDATDRLARCWTDGLVREAPMGRAWLLRVVSVLLPIATLLGGPDLVGAIVDRVDEVRRWWP